MKAGLYAIDDPAVLARGDDIWDRRGSELRALIREAAALASNGGNVNDNFDSLVSVTEKAAKILVEETVCKQGCSHCCYMPVSIGDFEAAMIGRHIGRDPARRGTIEQFLATADSNIENLTGVPCTFLAADGKCGIYPVRPIACRTHHSISDTPDACKVKDVAEPDRRPTPSILNVRDFDTIAVTLTMFAGRGFADIREYFPKCDS